MKNENNSGKLEENNDYFNFYVFLLYILIFQIWK